MSKLAHWAMVNPVLTIFGERIAVPLASSVLLEEGTAFLALAAADPKHAKVTTTQIQGNVGLQFRFRSSQKFFIIFRSLYVFDQVQLPRLFEAGLARCGWGNTTKCNKAWDAITRPGNAILLLLSVSLHTPLVLINRMLLKAKHLKLEETDQLIAPAPPQHDTF